MSKRKASAKACAAIATASEEPRKGSAPASSSSSSVAATAVSNGDKTASPVSPWEKRAAHIHDVVTRCGAVGYTNEYYGKHDGLLTDLSEEDLNRDLFHFIMTKPRVTMSKRYEKFVLQEQHGDSVMMLNTSFSYHIFETVPPEVNKILAKKGPPSPKFDALLALTQSLYEYDVWMSDYEDSDMLKETVNALAHAWKTILKLSDSELGIDPEFTRPAIGALLTRFQKKLHTQTYDKAEFNWK